MGIVSHQLIMNDFNYNEFVHGSIGVLAFAFVVKIDHFDFDDNGNNMPFLFCFFRIVFPS